MFQRFNHRAGHYVLLLAVSAGLFLVNLGGPSLWDIDEGNNAEAAREMYRSGDYVKPTFNFAPRNDKPALLYWLQAGVYRLFGINEFAARLPSALASAGTVLATYELGASLFGAGAGLLAGLVLASAVLFCAAAHFANPDALLLLFTTLTFLFFWRSFARAGRGWFVPCGVCSGLAFLAKGPVGLVLPLGVVGLFLLWSRRVRFFFDRRLGLGALAFLLAALPWYVWVGIETKGDFLRGFFLTHNLHRYVGTMENHGGSVFYYVAVLLVGFAPWSIFLGLTAWYALQGLRCTPAGPVPEPAPSAPDPRSPFRFLACWIGVYFCFFSLGGTKLPNYILPLYPPVALLTADFLDRWRRGVVQPPAWLLAVSLTCLALLGLGVGFGLLAAGGSIPLKALRGRSWPGLEIGALFGLLPVVAAALGWYHLRRQRRGDLVRVTAAAAVLFVGVLAAWGGSAFNDHKAPRTLAALLPARPAEPDIRVGCYQYFQPSLVFYSGRKVRPLDTEREVLDFLAAPLPVYVYVPAAAWRSLEGKVRTPHRVLGRRRDLYRNCDVLLVTNR